MKSDIGLLNNRTVEWIDTCIDEIADLTVGFVGKTTNHYVNNGIRFLRSQNVEPFRINLTDEKYIDEEFHRSIPKSQLEPGYVVIVRTGNPGASAVIPEKNEEWNCSDLVIIKPDHNKVNSTYLAAYLNLSYGVINSNLVGAVQQHFNVGSAKKLRIKLPPLKEQSIVARFIDSLNEKITTNENINQNLLEQAQALYREMFVNTQNESRKECRAEEYFDIAIGKTPPRKEHQWFTTNPDDVTWVSISDMGSCGAYISRSSEQLTKEAVEKFNIRVIPDNTVLLSFKLTVGRIAITHGEMTTNEAIAHFKTDKPYINEYLYCYLKDFNYQTMGSTSSIATAVNSKIIKAMPFIVPAEDEIARFHAVAGPIVAQILNNQLENDTLASLRDSVLPKLMSGELDVSEIEL